MPLPLREGRSPSAGACWQSWEHGEGDPQVAQPLGCCPAPPQRWLPFSCIVYTGSYPDPPKINPSFATGFKSQTQSLQLVVFSQDPCQHWHRPPLAKSILPDPRMLLWALLDTGQAHG